MKEQLVVLWFLALIVFSPWAAGGCTMLDRGSALKVAESGASVSNATASSMKAIRSGLDDYVEALYLLNPLTGRKLPDQEELDSIESIASSLTARVRVFHELGNTYAAFSGLATYDAEKGVRSAVNDLTTAVNDYAKTIAPSDPPPVSGLVGALAERGSGLFVRWYQSRLIRNSSEEIRTRIQAILELLDKETVHYQDIVQAEVTARGETAKEIWKRGLACPHPIIRQHVADFGLEYDPESLVAAKINICNSSDKAWKDAVLKVLNRRIDRRIETQREILASNAAALRSLINAHEQLEKGESISLENIRQQAAWLRELLEELARLRALDAEK